MPDANVLKDKDQQEAMTTPVPEGKQCYWSLLKILWLSVITDRHVASPRDWSRKRMRNKCPALSSPASAHLAEFTSQRARMPKQCTSPGNVLLSIVTALWQTQDKNGINFKSGWTNRADILRQTSSDQWFSVINSPNPCSCGYWGNAHQKAKLMHWSFIVLLCSFTFYSDYIGRRSEEWGVLCWSEYLDCLQHISVLIFIVDRNNDQKYTKMSTSKTGMTVNACTPI